MFALYDILSDYISLVVTADALLEIEYPESPAYNFFPNNN